MSLLLAELRCSPEGMGGSLTRSAFLFLQELARFVGGANPKDAASAGGGGSTDGGNQEWEEGDAAFWGRRLGWAEPLRKHSLGLVVGSDC